MVTLQIQLYEEGLFYVEVSESVLRARLRQRGRESEAEIEQRVARSQQFTDFTATHLIRIQNDQPPEISENTFVATILRLTDSIN